MIDKSEIRYTAKVIPGPNGGVTVLPKHTLLVHYPRVPGAAMLPQEAACSIVEANDIRARVLRERPDLRHQDVRLTTTAKDAPYISFTAGE